MKLPQFGQPQNPDPYEIPQPGQDRRKTSILMFGGIGLLLLLLGLLVFGGGKKPGGQQDLLNVMNQTGSALAAIEEYEASIQNVPIQNNVALTKILLRGNYQNIGILYQKTYDKKQKFSNNPKLDGATQKTLDAAVTNNTIDSELISALETKVVSAQRSLIKVKPYFKSGDSRQTIVTAQTDYQSIADILEKSQ
ncbi:hypothetical protein KBD20_01980 [Candidatus Saccharibacteria bacterium]|nr:hypothetical protein [Candidatus Saccharibacteria bacterium]